MDMKQVWRLFLFGYLVKKLPVGRDAGEIIIKTQKVVIHHSFDRWHEQSSIAQSSKLDPPGRDLRCRFQLMLYGRYRRPTGIYENKKFKELRESGGL